MDKRKKVVIISQPNLPIPDVKGGGIELLTRLIIEQNEIEKKYKLIVFSIYDEKAEWTSREYKYCKIFYIKMNKFSYMYGRALNLLARIFGQDRVKNRIYYSRVFEKIKYIEGVMAVVFEGGPLVPIGKFREYTNNLIYHSHVREWPGNKRYLYDKIITVSSFCQNDWLKMYPSQKIHILKNCIDSEKFVRQITNDEGKNIKSKLGIKEDDFVVVYVGRIIPLKGVMELVEAWKYIDNKRIKLLIIGSLYNSFDVDISYSMMLEQIVQKDRRIVLAGYVDNGCLYKYLQLCDVQVVPTIGDEAAGLVAVEGMASGLPLICTNSGGLPEYSCSGESIVVERGSDLSQDIAREIIRIYDDSAIKDVAKNKRDIVIEEYSKQVYYRDFFRILEA